MYLPWRSVTVFVSLSTGRAMLTGRANHVTGVWGRVECASPNDRGPRSTERVTGHGDQTRRLSSATSCPQLLPLADSTATAAGSIAAPEVVDGCA